jgi:hypothetical protein
MNEILKEFSPSSLKYQDDSIDSNSGVKISRRFNNQSFFHPIPESNSCSDVGIPGSFCPCHIPQEIHEPNLRSAAEMVVALKNTQLPSNCVPLIVKTISSSTKLSVDQRTQRFIIGFSSEPGNIELEAQIYFDTLNKTFIQDGISLQRTNRVNRNDIFCVRNDFKMELFCYCRSVRNY